ncbi:ATP:cob(I)alamin adenosyltransferase [Terrisporobacter othiniensis]|uniref:ATP:cob(I)alamin adenosyltransferase n=1 Tax=Terrisporobacter othiniensis TaxID=1577792 RepID=A0A0B3VXL8_9FIRM|nr:ATP:cob(I)alamin adenosyltransferase [Terrisporobacter othiniensis]
MEDNTCVELNLQTAKKIAEFAEEKAKEIKVPVVISIVDNGGNVILVHRMEDSLLASIDISLNKAYTAASLKMPTDNLKDLCKPGGELYGIQHTNNRLVIFGGGIPFIYKGKVVGAIGVSGGSVEEDICVCEYALREIMTK